MGDDFKQTKTYTPQIGEMPVKSTRKILNIIFIVDTSGSMKYEGRIQAVNEAFTKMIPALRQIQLDCEGVFEMRIWIMTFNASAEWIVEPTPIMEFNFEEIECSDWVTYYSSAFEELDEKMSRSQFLPEKGAIAQSYIMFMTDGEPTEDDNYQDALEELKNNFWFEHSQRYAVLIGKDAVNSSSARAAVEQFVVNPKEGIIDALTAETIAAEVQARTIKTIVGMTKRDPVKVQNKEENQSADRKVIKTTDDPFSTDLFNDDNFPSLEDIENGNYY